MTLVPMWVKAAPVTPGWYWFFGNPSKDRTRLAKMRLVKVALNGGGTPMYISDGGFFYPESVAGAWLIAQLPDEPDLAKLGLS